ncbi:MAG: glycosyltransferase family 2 protein [Cyanobacteria bacterium K_Offshore_surface_m2_239]|nr:glycosyltransferase family 2 protein [Cyanobacteria bacterium K_Offshore_surface_m2_239]
MITVIIPTHNRSALLGSSILSIISYCNNEDDLELLIIDNASDDNTRKISAALGSLLPNCRSIYEPTPGLHSGRHRGMQESKGSVLVYLDDDVEITKTWFLAIRQAFADPDVALLGGNNIPVFYGSTPSWLEDLWEQKLPDGSRCLPWLSIQEHLEGKKDHDPFMVWGCNFAIRKSVLLAAGGFHPDGMPKHLIRFRGDGETHVARYVADNKLKCIFDSKASVFHKVTPERMSLPYFRRRGFNQGISDSYAFLRNFSASDQQDKSNTKQKESSWLKKSLRMVKRRIFPEKIQNPALIEFGLGFSEGFAYHQHAYSTDPDVRDWVHKQNYF